MQAQTVHVEGTAYGYDDIAPIARVLPIMTSLNKTVKLYIPKPVVVSLKLELLKMR